MANGIATASSLDVIQPNQFEGIEFDEDDAYHIQASYYKGAPPQWVNFYLAEKNRTPFVKRNGYEEIKRLIGMHGRTRKTKVNLFHQPGSGGSTLAMQVVWDLRNRFCCTKLNHNAPDLNDTTRDLINLITQNHFKHNRKPILLLLDNADKLKDKFVESLQDRLIDELNNINNSVPVIILNCVRKVEFSKCTPNNTVLLKAKLQRMREMGEMKEFDKHHGSITEQFENEHYMFHGFNIIHGDFNSLQEYTTNACKVIEPPRSKRRPRRDQLFQILALVNSYAPDSDFLLDQCKEFLQKSKSSTHRQMLFEDEMGCFSDLLVTYTDFKKNKEYVRVAHPKIAETCVKLFRTHGVSLGELTHLFLKNLCAERVTPHLMQTAKAMLTMREIMTEKITEEKEKFPKLIQEINEQEGKRMCTRLLKEASRIFEDRTAFPQTLARFYYLEVNKHSPINEKDYINAEKWAEEAIRRHPNNSFIMDTLGQVHKHHLIHYGKKKCFQSEVKEKCFQSEVLRLGFLALEAFEKEEMAAEKEEAKENVNESTANASPFFNMRGKLGYLQVADQLFVNLQNINREWCDVLTSFKKIPESLAFKLKGKYCNLTTHLRAEVKKRFEFLEKYLTYSKPNSRKDDPAYIRKYADKCYAKYVGEEAPRVLKTMFEDTEETEMEEMEEDETVTLTDLKEFMRRQEASHSPEFYHLALLQPTEGQDLSDVVKNMRQAYEITYKKYFRSRYLVPLYMKTTDGWQTLSQLSLQPKTIEIGATNDPNEAEGPGHSLINLTRIQGTIRRPRILASLENTIIEVQPYSKEKVLGDGEVSFYLGFNIKGPMAFNIKYKPAKMD